MKTLLARCIKAAGSPTAGALFYRMCFWHSHMKVSRGGFLWIVKSRSDWLEETGLTLRQYETALKRLKDQGLVFTERHLFANKIHTFFRLSDMGIAVREDDEHYHQTGVIDYPQTGITHIQGEYNMESNSFGITNPPTPKGEGVSGEEDMASIKQLLAEKAYKAKVKPKANKGSPTSLGKVWTEELYAIREVFIPPLTQKALGQLKLFAKACPPDKAESILIKVMRSWPYFTGYVKSAAGLKTVPAEPNLDFLLKHVGSAISFAKPEQAPPVTKPKPKPEVQLIAPVKPQEEKASLDEIMAIIAEDYDDDTGK